MPQTEHHKSLARAFLRAVEASDFKTIIDSYTQDARIFTMGRTMISGEFTVQQLEQHSHNALDVFPRGLRFEILDMIAEGDRVMIEAESFGSNAAGLPYNNQYVFLMRFRNDKLYEFKEYFDSEMVTEVICAGVRPETRVEPSGRIVRV